MLQKGADQITIYPDSKVRVSSSNIELLAGGVEYKASEKILIQFKQDLYPVEGSGLISANSEHSSHFKIERTSDSIKLNHPSGFAVEYAAKTHLVTVSNSKSTEAQNFILQAFEKSQLREAQYQKQIELTSQPFGLEDSLSNFRLITFTDAGKYYIISQPAFMQQQITVKAPTPSEILSLLPQESSRRVHLEWNTSQLISPVTVTLKNVNDDKSFFKKTTTHGFLITQSLPSGSYEATFECSDCVNAVLKFSILGSDSSTIPLAPQATLGSTPSKLQTSWTQKDGTIVINTTGYRYGYKIAWSQDANFKNQKAFYANTDQFTIKFRKPDSFYWYQITEINAEDQELSVSEPQTVRFERKIQKKANNYRNPVQRDVASIASTTHAPEWLNPLSEQGYYKEFQDQLSVKLAWEKSDAPWYLVQISRDINFSKVVFEKKISQSTLEWRTKTGEGDYYLRVKTASSNWGDPIRIKIFVD